MIINTILFVFCMFLLGGLFGLKARLNKVERYLGFRIVSGADAINVYACCGHIMTKQDVLWMPGGIAHCPECTKKVELMGYEEAYNKTYGVG